jgi:hypothetical protein
MTVKILAVYLLLNGTVEKPRRCNLIPGIWYFYRPCAAHLMASQEAVFIIPGDNPRKIPYTRDKPCNGFSTLSIQDYLL